MNSRTRTFRIHDFSEFQAFQNSACPRRSRSHVRYTDRHKYCTHPRIKSLGCAVSRSRRAFAPKRQTVSHEGKSFRKGSESHFTKDFGFTKTPRRSTAIRLFALFRVIAAVLLVLWVSREGSIRAFTTNPLAPHSLWMGRDFNRVLTDFMVSSLCMWRKKTLLGG